MRDKSYLGAHKMGGNTCIT